MPIEPPETAYRMPDPRRAPAHGLVAGGGDLAPGTILAAYRAGIFPWPHGSGPMLWWSPDPRAVMPLEGFHESRSLRRLRRQGRYTVTLDGACAAVIHACAERTEGTWLTPEMIAAYTQLHRMGWVHSVEVWCGDALVGGVYGIAIGAFFAAESMFHRAPNTSKVALASLVEHLRERRFALLDVQLQTPHLASLGAVEIPRRDYLALVATAITQHAIF